MLALFVLLVLAFLAFDPTGETRFLVTLQTVCMTMNYPESINIRASAGMAHGFRLAAEAHGMTPPEYARKILADAIASCGIKVDPHYQPPTSRIRPVKTA